METVQMEEVDRSTLISRKSKEITKAMEGCSKQEIQKALEEALDKATFMYENLTPANEDIFMVFTMGWFMYACGVATSYYDEYRSAFAGLGKLYLHNYKNANAKPGRKTRM